MKEVFEGTLWEAEVVKGLLQAENIPCMLRDETLGAVTSPYLTVGGVVKLYVNEEDAAKAQRIIVSR
ncbi:MAG: DUF2007 domain-containing protein [Bacteroidaceae bacterium]|nr:DUF2007 domain-containing protein [Bacteroidaceae bacterium]